MRAEDPGSADAGERLHLPGVGDVCLGRAKSTAVPGDDAWLTPAEAAILSRFRVSKRAADWRLGRWVAKEVVAGALAGAVGPHDMEILAGPGGGPRARVLAPGAWPAVRVSLSHSAGTGFAVAAVADGDAVRLGCDIEEVAPRSEAFVSDYFTAEEAAWIRAGGGDAAPEAERAVRANLLWSAKESALKALGEGLRKDTRSVTVDVGSLDAVKLDGGGGAWRPLCVTSAGGERFAGWWRVADGLVWTVLGSA